MMDTIFRQYDIRGKVGPEIDIDEMYNLTIAIGNYLKTQYPQLKTVAVGMDGRIHSPQIKDHVVKALRALGLDVVFIGICPTPVLYYCMHTMPVDAGLMITASHNTKEYNGIKICLGKRSVAGQEIQEIKKMYISARHERMQRVEGFELPTGNLTYYNAIADYIAWMAKHFKHLVGYEGNFVIDCAYGAAASVVPELIKVMQFKHAKLLYSTIDGTFPAHEADPTDEKNVHDVRAAIKKHQAAFGIGFDGDADRMAPMTHDGQLVLGDKVLGLFACQILKEKPGQSIVFDVKCSSALADVIKNCGGRPVISATGHSIIKAKMKQEQAVLGGELSCHFFFADHYFGYDDGIYAALRLISLLQETGKSLSELISVFPVKYATPEIRIECEQDALKTIVMAIKSSFEHQSNTQLLLIDGVRVSKPYGWGLVRASNTQPVICLRFEADSPQELEHIKQDFKQILKQHIDEHSLQEAFSL